MRRLPPDSFVRSFDQLFVLLTLNLVVWAGLDTVHAQDGAQLLLDGVFGLACYLLLGLFGCALVARAQDREADTRGLLIPVLSVSPYVLVVFWMSADATPVKERPLIALLVCLLYLAVLSIRTLRAAYGFARSRAAVVAIALLIAAPRILDVAGLDTRLWVTDDAQEPQDADDSTEAEPLLYDQPARIAAAVERVIPEQQGTPGVYFVGFAGDGDQGIFKREALLLNRCSRTISVPAIASVELINDIEDRDSYPLATVSGLQQTLKLLASRMDVDADVLVLTLTSHGSKEGLAVTNGALPLLQLGPADLRQALDESGIKWRVLVVSACYAGVFLEPLKTDTTLIVTASDAEHSSFGCEDDRDLTYFGEAFLKDALPTSVSVEEAFKKAADLVQRREAAEHLVHSNPQFFAGAAIRGKLAGLEAGPGGKRPGAVIVQR